MDQSSGRLKRLFDEANAAVDSVWADDLSGFAVAEPAILAFLDEVEANPASRPYVVTLLAEGVRGHGQSEFLVYCFYRLRWPELSRLTAELGVAWETDPRKWNLLSDLNRALDGQWADAGLFAKPRSPQQ